MELIIGGGVVVGLLILYFVFRFFEEMYNGY